MAKQTQARVITGLLVAAALVWAWWQQGGTGVGAINSAVVSQPVDRSAEPQSAIYAMLDAARDGDLDAYIACYSGELRRQLEQNRQEMSDEGFRKYLAERDKSIKGVALMSPEQLPGGRAKLDMEYVYAGFNEAQTVYLMRSAGGWTIDRVDQAQVRQQEVPYGTPIGGAATE